MARKALKWRESASLIFLTKDRSTPKPFHDFKALLLSRAKTVSFLPNYHVFPGGVRENADSSLEWLQHFRNFGISEKKLLDLVAVRKADIFPRPNIFKAHDGESLPRDISLRITAIREAFEEAGIMLCRDKNSIDHAFEGRGSLKEDFDRKHWQHVVHNDPKEFLKLCQHLNVVPDLWSLHEWSVWLTPASFKPRFETVFYLVALENTPHIELETNEIGHYSWKYPRDYLLVRPKILLPWPQMYELLRLSNFTELEKLRAFSKDRIHNDTALMFAVDFQCQDGVASVLPGDTHYPTEPYNQKLFKVDTTLGKFRESSPKVNRYEYIDINFGKILANISPTDGHLPPISVSDWAKL